MEKNEKENEQDNVIIDADGRIVVRAIPKNAVIRSGHITRKEGED